MKAEPVTSKDPNSYIQASAEMLAETLLSKNSDYAPTGEFSNFEKAAEFAGTSPLEIMVGQIGIKMTRIQTLLERGDRVGNNESLKDSFLDLAGYATIAHAYLERQDPDRKIGVGEASREHIRNAMDEPEPLKSWEDDPGLHGNPHTCNNVVARGDMGEPLGYFICGICGVCHV